MKNLFLIAALFIAMALSLSGTSIATAQAKDERPNYMDEIIPVRGKPFKGKILKFDGTILYVEITKHKITQIITVSVDSLREVNKDFGPTKISIWKQKPKLKTPIVKSSSPAMNMRGHLMASIKKDTAIALAVERDSIFVGAVDRKDTSTSQSTRLDQRPVPLKRYDTEYPSEGVSRRMEGIVKLRLWIDKEGIPKKYEILDCTDSLFVQNSVTSAMKWEFSPAIAGGTPVGVWASVTFEYRFQK